MTQTDAYSLSTLKLMSAKEVREKSLKMRVIWFVQHNEKIHLVIEFSQLCFMFFCVVKRQPKNILVIISKWNSNIRKQ